MKKVFFAALAALAMVNGAANAAEKTPFTQQEARLLKVVEYRYTPKKALDKKAFLDKFRWYRQHGVPFEVAMGMALDDLDYLKKKSS